MTKEGQGGFLCSLHAARFLAGASDPAHLPRWNYPEIAFAGRSNVGKSALLNRLVGQHHLARVSKTPGRTQQINFFLVDERILFVDLPGYGFARVPVAVKGRWKELVEAYLTRREKLRAVVVIVDLRRGVGPEDVQLIAFLSAHQIAAVIVATKADKLAYGERQRRARALAVAVSPMPVIVCSASSGEGVTELWKVIEEASG